MAKWWRAGGAAVVLLGLVVGLPILLVELAGWPLPTSMPDWGHLWQMVEQGDIPAEPVVSSLAVVLWALWLAIVWSFAWELATTLATTSRGDRPPRATAPLVPAAVSTGVGRLVATILAVGVVTTSALASTGVAAASLPTPVLVTEDQSLPWHAGRVGGHDAPRAPMPTAPDAPRWVAGSTDTLWDVASTALGDATRVDEIVAMNAGVRAARPLRPGHVLVLPTDARVPADRRPVQPALEDAAVAVPAVPATTVVVAPGDTLWEHASGRLELGGELDGPASIVDYVAAIAAANPNVIEDPDLILPGEVLTMPAIVAGDPAAAAPLGAARDDVHVVTAGDTLWDVLAAHYGAVDGDLVRVVADHNGIVDADVLAVGQRVVLPAVVGLGTPAVAVAPSADPGASTPVPADEPRTDPVPVGGDAPDTDEVGDSTGAPGVVAPTATAPPISTPRSVPVITPAVPTPVTVGAVTTTSVTAASTDSTIPPGAPPADGLDADRGRGSPSPIGIGEAALLSTGLLALLAARRRARLRSARPRARLPEPPPMQMATERAWRAIDASERLLRVDVAVRAAAATLIDGPAQIALVRCSPDGGIELTLTAEATLPGPWSGGRGCWTLPAAIPVELLADVARTVGAPCLAFTQLGVDDVGCDVYADLEALGVLAVVADDLDEVDAIVNGVAATLATAPMSDTVNLVGVGLDEHAFVGRAGCVAATVDEALTVATSLVGTTASARHSTFVLRARHTGGESWEPAVVLIGADRAGDVGDAQVAVAARRRGGVALVIGGEAAGAPWTLRRDDGEWRLEPIGMAITPVGLSPAELVEIEEMLQFASRPLDDDDDDDLETAALDVDAATGSAPDGADADQSAPAGAVVNGDERRIVANGVRVDHHDVPFIEPDWALLVRLLGPVDIVDRDGRSVSFERSKALELIAWLTLHRPCATRSGARTALWELDVRDSTFANIVSEARRAMARHVAPPEHAEWVGRTQTDELPLHRLVVSDADLVRARLNRARLQPPELAIETLRPAVELIRDVPLAGTGYLWPDAEGTTSNLVLLATSSATELAQHCLSMGDVEGVFWATSQGLRVLAAHEELIALRMRAHACAGDLAGVRQEWETYERALQADPWGEAEPAPKLVLLRRQLLSPSS